MATARDPRDDVKQTLGALDDSVEVTLDIRPGNGGNALAPLPGAE